MEDKEMAEFLIRRVMHAPRGILSGNFDGDLREKFDAAREAGFIEAVSGATTGRYDTGFRATEAGKQFAIKNI